MNFHDPKANTLFSPYELGSIKLKNRFVMSPMTRSRAVEGRVPNPLAADYYAQRAGAGLIVTEATQVSPQGVGYVRTPGIHSKEQVEGWKKVTDAVHKAGGKIFLSKDVVVFYYPRASFDSLAKQYFKYGMGRARTLLKHRRLPTIRPLIPFGMTAAGALIAAIPVLHPAAPFAFGSYAFGTLIEAIRVGRKAGLETVPIVWAIFPTLHVSHGTGFAYGLVKYLTNPDWSDPELLDRPAG